MIFIFQITTIILSYIIGSFPTAYLLVKLVKQVDIRHYGSGNVGATNVFRIIGVWGFIITLLVDIFKGILPVVLVSVIFTAASGGFPIDLVRILCVVTVICGHNWPVFLRFKGGKGVATSAGAFFALVPYAMIYATIVWILIFLITKVVSLSSMLSSVFLTILLFVFNESLLIKLFGVLLTVILIWRHKENIKRLLAGKERVMTEMKVTIDEKKQL
ncbi:glycerol-3-phosphate 1-O-acyltransferase PlsY [Chlamydiota bacterium]